MQICVVDTGYNIGLLMGAMFGKPQKYPSGLILNVYLFLFTDNEETCGSSIVDMASTVRTFVLFVIGRKDATLQRVLHEMKPNFDS